MSSGPRPNDRIRRVLGRAQPVTMRLFLVAVPLTLVLGPILSTSWWLPLLVLAVLFLLATVRPRPLKDPAPVRCLAPVRGRWAALNSPATKVPSHGTHGYGQTYAIDLCGPRGPGPRTRIGWGVTMRRPGEFTAFGRPVLSMGDGTVVRVADGQRDHRSRESWPAIGYLVLESLVRELGGPRFLLGNHVVVDLGHGVFAVHAHLRRGSIRVRPGDPVLAGEQLGEVGSSGNTSEPHLHVHLMDDPSPSVGRGLPFHWTDLDQQPGDLDRAMPWITRPSTELVDGVPAAGQVFTGLDPTSPPPSPGRSAR